MTTLETNEKELQLETSADIGQIRKEYGTPFTCKEREQLERLGDIGWRRPFVRSVLSLIVWCAETLVIHHAVGLRHPGYKVILEIRYGELMVYQSRLPNVEE